ncbi:UDP-N-acetylmuramoyl-L-alanine--D-glutamate ligase [Actinocorallia sp. A-T 12471]|uniref:UDP-N-acetylmuramoyl-L-alanine--D-glutamate ligase n=1 Tax=Actinocorallia sp. A-T 12471 TaxID=3089813 RepID=UPI0029CAE39B|nr:UDP-N-acetylmuramoyl-L-alanine--D-glutamate ligase [Actinocorallia sp. A-T 12471]MDX6743073.1 UDP-N-acetylmuramoyl-L-alanine--D-glutamate ligase [Actinocorallia sp. A-T 12471]
MGFKDVRVVVAGLGVSGRAAARALAGRGAVVTGVDARTEIDGAAELTSVGVRLRLGDGDSLPDGVDLVVTSPGWKPTSPLLAAAAAAGVEVIGEVELAWRLRPETGAAPWLAITGTNGKTTAVRMLTSILRAAGLDAVAVGNVGEPIVEAVTAGHDVLAVELSSYQLHWSSTLDPRAAVILNLAPDHLDWHGSLDAYGAAKAKIYGPNTVRVCNADDPVTVALAGPDAQRFTLGTPAPGEFGVVEDLLVDRATTEDPVRSAEELASLADVAPFAPHNVANALAAAALARTVGASCEAVREGLRAFRPDPHRIAHVTEIDGVAYVDDSKATNPHAAAASLAAYEHIVWIAGGLLKGADVDDLVRQAAPRLRGAVLLGADRAQIADALARHAPDVPVLDVSATDTCAMDLVVTEAARLARPGDTVLLAPAGASMDMFANYGARGDAFAAAAHRLAAARNGLSREA